MPKPVSLGEPLRSFRRAAGLIREAFAAKAGVSAFDLKQVEGDAREPHLATLQKLVRSLGPPGNAPRVRS
jgi:transcriptional regulator with XRE-family HTH domain